jgi:hypothetical protein
MMNLANIVSAEDEKLFMDKSLELDEGIYLSSYLKEGEGGRVSICVRMLKEGGTYKMGPIQIHEELCLNWWFLEV